MSSSIKDNRKISKTEADRDHLVPVVQLRDERSTGCSMCEDRTLDIFLPYRIEFGAN